MKESSAAVQYPQLTHTNYHEWALLMQVNLEAAGLWQVIELVEDDYVDYRDNRLALAVILRLVPTDKLGTIGRKHTRQGA